LVRASASAYFVRADTSIVKEHIILGRDNWDAERQKDLWLAQHPAFRILKVHPPRGEQNLLTRFGGSNVPRVSITVHYEEPEVGSS
jgi:hypothetical protein